MPSPKAKPTKVRAQTIEDLTDDMPKEAPRADLPAAPRTTRAIKPEEPKARPGVKYNKPVEVSMDSDTARQAAEYLSHLNMNTDGADEIEPEETTDLVTTTGQLTTTGGLPALINSELILYKGKKVTPEWIEVRDLPAVPLRAIRQMGRQVFSLLTDTPLERIEVISTLTNSKDEVAGMATWIQKHGRRITEGAIENMEQLGGYDAKVQLWYARGFEFLMVKDFAGIYIYSWDAKNSLSGSAGETHNNLLEALNTIDRALNRLL